jgi:hypothetical protein
VEQAKYLVRGFCADSDGSYIAESPAETLEEAHEKAKRMMRVKYLRADSAVRVTYVEVIATRERDAIVQTFGLPSRGLRDSRQDFWGFTPKKRTTL